MTNSGIGLVCLMFQTMVILTLYNAATAYWCTPKKHELTQLEQLQAISDAKMRCIAQKDTPLNNFNETSCPKIFDGLICWPMTKAGTRTTLQCPSYVHGFNTAGYATKECLQNGEWFVHPGYNTTYTNFTGCIHGNTLAVDHNGPSIEELMKDHMHSIQILYRVGYGISLTFLLTAVIIMTCLRKLRCQRNIIHVNLFLSYIFRCIICFIKDENGIPEEDTNMIDEVIQQITSSKSSSWCKFVHVLFFYFVVTNYMWIFLEGIYLNILIFVTTFHNITKKVFRCLVILGWVTPVVFVIPWVIVRKMYEDTLCWNLHTPETGYVWILQAPIITTLCINFVFFLNIIRVLFTKLSSGNANSRDPKRYRKYTLYTYADIFSSTFSILRKLARSTLVLIPLFGVHYIVFMAIPICLNPEAEIVWMYTELFFSSFQGFILSMLFCFLNSEVRNEISKHWKWHRLRRQSLVSSRSTRTFSIQSSGSARDQGSPTIIKHANGFIRESYSSNSIVKQNMTKDNSDCDIHQHDINNVNIPLKMKDDNENEHMPILSGEKVSFF